MSSSNGSADSTIQVRGRPIRSFFNSLRHIYPDSIIIAICKSHVAAIFENHPSINGIIEFEKKDLSGFRSTTNSGISLESIDLDKFYLLSDSYRAAYLAFKSKSPVRIGYSGQGRNRLLSKVFNRSKEKKNHRSMQYINLLDDKNITAKELEGKTFLLGTIVNGFKEKNVHDEYILKIPIEIRR